jgi:peptidoglycan hydrolase-like protein with peptidoglycan-binding domain
MWLCRSSSLIISCLVFLGFNPGRANTDAYGYSIPASIKLVQVNSPEPTNQTTDPTTPNPEVTTQPTSTATPEASPEVKDKIILRPGNYGDEVKELQTKLKQLGFYDGVIDGGYGGGTRTAVAKFQSANGLGADGIVGTTTKEKIEVAIQQKLQPTPSPSSSASTKSKSGGGRGIFWWVLIGVGMFGTVGAIAFFMRGFGKSKSQKTGFTVINSQILEPKTEPNVITQYPKHEETVIQEFERVVPDVKVINQLPAYEQTVIQEFGHVPDDKVINQYPAHEQTVIQEFEHVSDAKFIEQYPAHEQTVIQEFETDNNESDFYNPSLNNSQAGNYQDTKNLQGTNASASELFPPQKTSRLAKVSIIDELVKDIRSADSTKRRKAIWDLGQQGDSRAIQPLVDLMIDADSQQRSLILAALSEISVRTLKPMNRALAMSLQDESPEVRQNAIRDLTRVYDLMAQVSQMLVHATQDDDPQVQETAKYALSQMNKIRALSGQDKDGE